MPQFARGLIGLGVFFGLWEAAVRTGAVSPVFLPPPGVVLARLVELLGQPAFQRNMVASGLAWVIALAIAVAVAVVLWQLVTTSLNSAFFPPPAEILAQLARLLVTDAVTTDILPSVGRVLAGWLIAVVVGTVAGTALGRARTGMDYAGSLFAFFRAIPPPALIPVFMVLFGIATSMKLAVIVFGALWQILLNTVDGVRSVDQVKTDTARSFRIPKHLWMTMVVLPAALPKIFAGLRLLGALGCLLNGVLLAVQRRVLRWQQHSNIN